MSERDAAERATLLRLFDEPTVGLARALYEAEERLDPGFGDEPTGWDTLAFADKETYCYVIRRLLIERDLIQAALSAR